MGIDIVQRSLVQAIYVHDSDVSKLPVSSDPILSAINTALAPRMVAISKACSAVTNFDRPRILCAACGQIFHIFRSLMRHRQYRGQRQHLLTSGTGATPEASFILEQGNVRN